MVAIPAAVLVFASTPSERASAANLVVNDTADRVDTNAGNGECRTSTGTCSLRAAIQEANALVGPDTITVPAGTYAIAIAPLPDLLVDPANGDFDITDAVTITGQGSLNTIIDAGTPPAGLAPEVHGLDRLFDVHPTAVSTTITGLTVRDGYSDDSGGAIRFGEFDPLLPPPNPGRLRLVDVSVLDNYSGAYGGGVHVVGRGRLEVTDSTLSGNGASAGGAAINNMSTGTVVITDSVVAENPGPVVADPTDPGGIMLADPTDFPIDNGAINNQADMGTIGTIAVRRSSFTANASGSEGPAIHNSGDGIIAIEESDFTGNVTEASGGAIYSAGGTLTIDDSALRGNRAHDGGALYAEGETTAAGTRPLVEITDSELDGNHVEASGGAIVSGGDGELIITGSDFTENFAPDEGGAIAGGGRSSIEVTDTRFIGNQASGSGGAVIFEGERSGSVVESLFRENVAGVSSVDELGLPVEGDGTGGGLHTGGSGPFTVTDSTFERNEAHGDGGGIAIDGFGTVRVTDTVIRDNHARGEEAGGGGVENSGERVTFIRVLVTGNTATGNGGGIHNTSSNEFTVVDTTITGNKAENGGGLANASDSTLVMRGSLIANNLARFGPRDDTGLGGGLYSIGDAGGIVENTTIAGNTARVRGGGVYNDADGGLRLANVTIWRNSAPLGGGIGVMESDAVPTVPPTPLTGIIVRNTIVAGSIQGGGCDGAVKSEGGNIDMGAVCFDYVPQSSDIVPVGDRMNGDPRLDALADNGGPTLTHALREGSVGIDGGLNTVTTILGTMDTCPDVDQRNLPRPVNERCDVGAYEHQGPFPPADLLPPDTEFLRGPFQDTEESMAFEFTGRDDESAIGFTPVEELTYECRLLELDPTEPPEPVAPGEPVPPELQFRSCASPWSAPLAEEGNWIFEVVAIDRAGRKDPTPASHPFDMTNLVPPNGVILEAPVSGTSDTSATFTFTATDDITPPQFMEYECRLDTRDPEAWLECFNPMVFSNLEVGTHTFEVRVTDSQENIDPTPARHTWTIAPPTNCDEANISLTAAADGWVDEVNPAENKALMSELSVNSDELPGNAARALFRFNLPTEAAGCTLESATLRLYHESSTEGRTLQAIPIAAPWSEQTLTWVNQPPTTGPPASVVAGGGGGYLRWDVTAQVAAAQHGFLIRDALEVDPEGGGDQSFASREEIQDPPPLTLPQLVLRYAPGTAAPLPTTPPAPPVDTVVTCGQVLTQSTRVMNDLTDCLGEGLVIGESNIIVDLNGHVIDGPDYLIENATGQEEGFPPGIRNSGHDHVTIRNGTVQQFGFGVLLTAATWNNTLEDLTILRHAVAGVELNNADNGRTGNRIVDSVIRDNELGVQLLNGSEGTTISGGEISGNLGEALYLWEANRNVVENVTIHGIPTDPNLDSDGGILLESASENVFRGNTIRDTGDAGFVLTAGSDDNLVGGPTPADRNTMYRNGDAGVYIQDSSGNRVVGNTMHLESDGGVVLNGTPDTSVIGNDLRFNPNGVEAADTDRLLLEGNDASDAQQDGFALGAGADIVVRGNTANRTGSAGIALEGGSFAPDGVTPVDPALVEGNTANENLADGISVAAGGHVVKDNNGHNNAGYGISSDELNVDGGGNRASGNGRPEQCLGVVCNLNDNVPLSTPDLTPPETTDLLGPPDGHNGFGATFTFSATDNATPITAMTFECRVDAPPDPIVPIEPPEPPEPGEPPDPPDVIDGVGWEECANPQFYPQFFEAGDHHFEVRATDYAHNVDLTPLRWEWTVVPAPLDEGPDTLPPSTTILAAPTDPSTASSVTFRFGGSDNRTPGPELRYECALDPVGAPAWTACTSPHTVSGLTAGDHRFEVRSIDFAGNVDASPAVHTWTYTPAGPDTTAPDTTIDSHPDPVTVLTTGTFRFSSPDPTATFECRIGGSAWGGCTSPRSVLALDVTDHTFEVRAVDPADNPDSSPASFTWSVTAPPVATSLYCGQIVTQSVELTNDMLDCPEIGLVIGAPRITIDLGGYTLDGVGVGVGIRNSGFDDVTVTNGTITGFDVGVHLEPGTSGNIVQSLDLNQNQEAAIALVDADNGSTGNTVRRNVVAGNDLGIIVAKGTRGTLVHDNIVGANSGDGIRIDHSSDNTVEDNSISGSSGGGVQLVGAASNRVLHNELSGNGIVVESGYPVQVIPSVPSEPPIVPEPTDVARPSPDNLVERNSLEGEGIEVNESNGNQLVGNEVHAASNGIDLYNSHNGLIRQNDVTLNSGGIELIGSRNNRIEANNASETNGSGISLSALSLSNVIVGNTANVNSVGIDVSDPGGAGSGSVIEGNIASNNEGDGIQISYPGHTITRNTANNNGNWGIYVALGASIDGGGNSASDNTQPAQCFNVRCDGQAAPPELVPPDTVVLRGPANPSSSSTATIRFTGTDNVSLVTFECALDLEAFAPCTSPTTLTGVTTGAHTFQVRAKDASGNVDASPAAHSWERVASTLPVQTSIDSTPDKVTVATSAAFTFSASEPGATFQCSLDSQPLTGCNSGVSYTGLAVGAHTFEVAAAGDPSTASYSWTIGAAPVDAGIGCGEIVTRSVRLTNDIIECPGIAMVVGAPNITIDLNGHLVDGAGEGVGVLNPRHDGVTVTNGSITGFGIGVQLNPGVADGVISALRVDSNEEAGIVLSDADDSGRSNTIRDNELSGNMVGLHLTAGTRGALVRGNTFTSNTGDAIWIELANGNRVEDNEISLSSGAAVLLARASDNDIVGNTLEGNLGGGIAVGEEELPSNGNLVEGNTLSTTGGFGISVVDSDDNRIVDNVVENSIGDAVVLELVTDTVVEGNVLLGNGGGISVAESSSNRIEANLAVGATGSGVALDTASLDNAVRLNTASSNVGDGIEIADLAPSGQGNLVERNTTNGNGGDGIIAAASGHTVTANVANFNGGFGMFAVPGNVDGGGNQATGNVEPQQCEGIACTIGEAPGAPQTILLEGPPAVSNSHTAAFFYTATDDNSALIDIVFECRFDSTDPLQWEDCEYPAIFSNLAPGEHTVEIRAIDAGLLADPTPVSVTWTYVRPPAGEEPDTFIDLAPPAETPMFEALFTFTSDEPDVTYECQVDALGWQPCGQEQPPEVIIDYSFFLAEFEDFEVGPHTFRVRAIDIEGNVDPSPATHSWSIAAGPITTIISGPADEPTFEIGEPLTGGQTNETTATFRYASDNAPDSTYECSLDFGPFVPCNTPAGGPDPSVRTVTYTNLGIGEHIFRVFATSPELGEEMEAVEYEWEVLEPLTNAPPETVLVDAPADNTSQLMFEFQGTDDFTPPGVLTFECGLDTTNPVEFVDCVSPLNVLELAGPEGLGAGDHTFAVRAVDATDPDGQPDPTPATHEWTHVLDVVEPQTTISASPPLRILAETPAMVTFTGSDNATPAPPTDPEAVVPPFTLVFECSLDGALFEACDPSPAEYTGLEPGTHTVRVRAVDTRGNTDASPATATWTVVGAPVTTFSQTPPVSTASTTATFAFSSDQSPVTSTCTLNGWAVEPCASPLTINGLWGPSTQFTLEVAATNEFGLVEENPATFSWTVNGPADVTAPDTTITEHPLALTRNPHATFAFTSTQIGSTFDCSLDGAPFGECETPLELLELTAGAHTLRVRAVDASGNQDPTPASYTWTVDGPPITTITGFPLEDATSSEATFTFTSSDPGSTFECFLDGLYEPCTSPKTYTGLVRGDHVFAVRATDPSGNLELEWVEHEWTINIGVNFTQAPADPTDSTTATFAFASTIPGATMLCSLDGAAALPCTSPKTYTNLTAGTHEFSVEVVDPQQLVDPLPIVYTWTIVDVTPPNTTITDGPTNPSESGSPTFTFTSNEANTTFQCRLDAATVFTACPEPATFEGLAFGSHTLRVRAVDSAGLFDLSPDIWTWSIVADTTAPDTTIDSGPPLTNADIDAIFAFSGTDAGTPALDLEFECRLDAGVYEPCDSPHDVQDLAPGTHTLRVRAVDLELNVDPTPAVYTWTVLGPINTLAGVNVIVEAYQAEPLNGTEPPASAEVTFPVVTVQGSTTLTQLTSAPALPAGFVVASALYYDLSTTASYLGQPMVCFEFDPAAFATPQSVRLLHYTGGTWTDVSSSGDPANGEVCATVTTFSPFALAQSTAPIADQPPDTTLTVGPPALTVNFIHVIEFTGTDDWTLPLDLEFECLLDGVSLGTCSTLEEIEAETAGEHLLQVRAIDELGQVDPTPAERRFTIVDLTAPDTAIDVGPDSPTTERTATFEFIAEFEPPDPPGATFECALDAGDFAPCTSPYTVTIPEPAAGAHVLMVRAVDLEGNIDPTPDIYEWLIEGPPDTTAPDTIFVAGPPNPTPLFDALVTFTSDEAGVEFECSIDGGPFEGCESAVELTDLQPGPHSVASRAIDEAGNVDPTPASYAWTISPTPNTTITAWPPNPSPGTTALFSFTSDQAGSRFECNVDAGEWTPCTSPHLVTFADPEDLEGPHTFQVRAVNSVNPLSFDTTPSTFSWTVGLPPDTTITLAETIIPDPADPALTLRLAFTGTDDFTNPIDIEFECRLDGEPFDTCDLPQEYDLTTLTPGLHTFDVRAVDAGGSVDPTPDRHTFTVEPTPDTTILTGPTVDGTTATSATFTFSSDLSGMTFECRLDLAPAGYSPCASGVTFTGLALGEHLLEVRAKTASGNVDQTPAEYEWLVGDDTPPTATILTGPPQAPATTTDTTVTFTFTGTANGGSPLTFQCSLSGPVSVALQACSQATGWTNPTPLLPGAYTFELIPMTPHLLVDAEPQVWEFVVVDETDPQTTIVDGPNVGPAPDLASGPFAAFVFASSEADSTFECSFDATTWESCSITQEYSSLTPGVTTLSVRAIDSSGNVDETPASHTWTVFGPPETTIVPPVPAATTTEQTATFAFTSDQTGVTFECSLNGAVFVDCTPSASVTYTDLAPGSYTFEVQATNGVGLTDETAALHEWAVVLPPDTTPPIAQVVTGPPAVTTATQAVFTFSANEAGVTYECAIDGGSFGSCANPLTINDVQPGAHTLAVRATDAAGNIGPATPLWTWTVDGPADTTITSGPLDDTRDTTATFTFTANETGVTFQCSSDGAAYATCTSPLTITGLAPDSHTLLVRTVDSAGNIEPQPAEWSWDIIESEPPEVTITSQPPATTLDTTATFTFLSDEPGSTFVCSLELGAYAPCTTPKTYTDLAVGVHVFAVKAVDPAGNESPAKTVTWTIEAPDTTPPVSSFGAGGPAATTSDTGATFTFSANEPSATFNCSLDTAPFAACTSPVTVSGLALGNHTFRVRARDAAGNIENPGLTYAWTVVAPPPDCGTELVLSATGDAWLEQSAPGSNKGVDSTLKVTSKSSNQNVRTVIRFGVPATVPPGCVVQSATLRMYQNGGVNGRTLRALRLTGAFNETAVTWSNQPASTGTFATTTSSATAGWRAWNVTAQLQAAYNANQLHGFLIRDATEGQGSNEQQFHSREKATERPELVLRFGPATPPPTTTTTTTTTTVAPGTTTTTTVPATTTTTTPSTTTTTSTTSTSTTTTTAPTTTTTTTAPPACATSTVTVPASADSWILQSSPSSNNGTDGVLKVDSKSGNDARALVRFNLPAIPAGCRVTNTQLRLFAGSSASGRTLEAIRVAAAWTEGGVTWANQPGTTGPAVTAPSGAGWREWSVTTAVQAMYTSGNNGFLIRDASEGGGGFEQQLHSREKTPDNPPQLVITFGP